MWLRTKRFSKGQSHKLQPKFTGPYVVKEVARNHTYVIEQNGRQSKEAKSRLKAYNPAENPLGRIPTLVEPNRQLERKGLKSMGQQSRSNEDTWLIHQKNDEKHLDNLLQTVLGCGNINQQPSAKELEPPKRRKLKNNLEKEVIFPKEGNSNNPDSIQDDVEVALPCQEREDNLDAKHEQEEAEPSVTRDLIPTPLDSGVEGGVMDRPQRVRRPPAWFGDFVLGGELDQSFAGSQLSNTHLNQVAMAQRQLDQTPLELQDMWHLSDDEDETEKRLPGEGLDISWIAVATKRDITDKFYSATAGEGKCTVDSCEYFTLSWRRLLEHLVTHYIVYVTDCKYTTSRRDSAVKHLQTCHNRVGSITQADEGSRSRLRELNPSLPISVEV